MRFKRGNVERIAVDLVSVEKLKREGFIPMETVATELKEMRQDMEGMTLQELKEEARKRGLKGYSALTKEQLLDVLKEVV